MVKIAMKNKNGALKQNFLNFAKMLPIVASKGHGNFAKNVPKFSPTRALRVPYTYTDP